MSEIKIINNPYKVVLVKRYGVTATKPARVAAFTSDNKRRKVWLTYEGDHSYNEVFIQFCKKMDWTGEFNCYTITPSLKVYGFK